MKKYAVFMNGDLGLRILDFLLQRDDAQVVCVVINSKKKISLEFEKKLRASIDKNNYSISIWQYNQDLWNDEKFINESLNSNFGVSVLFGHIIPDSFLNQTKLQIANLHPSLLPIGRGADPVAWSIIESRKFGATMHKLTKQLDEGPILAQKDIALEINLTSGEAYQLVIESLYKLFIENFEKWVRGELNPIVQVGNVTEHKTKDLEELREQLKRDGSKFEPYLRTINALNYDDDRKAVLKLSDGNLWQIEITWTKMNEDRHGD